MPGLLQYQCTCLPLQQEEFRYPCDRPFVAFAISTCGIRRGRRRGERRRRRRSPNFLPALQDPTPTPPLHSTPPS